MLCCARCRRQAAGWVRVKILAVGDSYMPSRFFREAFVELELAHDVVYGDVVGDPAFAPSTPSEHRLHEYLGTPSQLVEWMTAVEVLAVHGAPVTEEVLDASRDLQLVCCARGGPVNIDVAAVTARGLPLVNTPGKNAEAVADLTLAFLVMLARGLPNATRFLDQGRQVRDNWEGARFMGVDLRDQTLGLIGYGQVGQRVARRALGFGMSVLVYDPYVEAGDFEQAQTLPELLGRADFVSLHARASAENDGLIDQTALAAMKPGAFLVNTARESLVDEDALDAALASGHLGGAALDVFEPGIAGERAALLRHENVVLTPHIGGATAQTLLQGARMIAAEIEHFASQEPVANVVNVVNGEVRT
jgi:D-3-phosphoglycerate dehydrogenase / 2-oxoglutarate reductase